MVIDRDNITIQGAGSDETTINLTGDAVAGGAFQIGTDLDNSTYTGDYTLSTAASEGQTYLHLTDASGIEAGDVLWIELENTDAYLDAIGDTTWREDKALRTSMVEVASVNGNTVTLTNGVAFDFSTATSIQVIDVAENVKLGGFTVESGLAEQAADNFTNVSDAYDRSSVITLSATSNVKLFDITIDNAPSNGITISQSIYVEGSNLTVDGAVNKGDGGNGYAFQLKQVYDSSLVGLEAYDTRHAVLFASWTSEANNYIQVRETNRDINFHGGQDHDNVVEVINSIRTDTEANYMSPAVFINDEGTSYGAPTDADANTITFVHVEGTNKSEELVAADSGATFYARAGADTLIGGDGDDKLYGEKGNDTIVGSGGDDVIDGGVGTDTLTYDNGRTAYTIGKDLGGHYIVLKPDGSYDTVSGVETIEFNGSTVKLASLSDLPTVFFGSDDADKITISGSSDIVLAGDGFDRIVSAYSYALGDDAEALEFSGSSAVDGYGNALDNAFTGNDASNKLYGYDGDDRFYARGGNDYVYGGDGDDLLYGQAGNDRLYGGDGDDTLNGSSGADTFVFSTGSDTIEDFSLKAGDRLDVEMTSFGDADDFLAAFKTAAATSGDTLASLGIDVSASGTQIEIHVLDSDGTAMDLVMNGATLSSLLASSDWIV
ncbi:MAG: calcium-binding protein [Rubrivivax sp.]